VVDHLKKNVMETRRESVLVLDDYPDSADTLVEVLRIWGFKAQACYSTEAGQTLAAVLRPQVIVMEPTMRGQALDGYQLARLLRQQRGPEELLLVALSGSGQPQDRLKAVQAGFDAFVLKPATGEAILTLLQDRTRPPSPTS
jgi:CheY-like chemotaxis protein